MDIQQKTDLIVSAIRGKRADRVLIGPDIDQSYICQMDGKYFDYYSTLPANQCMIAVEQQDFRHALETIGKDHFISCAYPIRTFASHTKEESVQQAKELLDIGMGVGGNFYFGFDKPPFLLNDGTPDKIKAVFDYVAEHGVYGG